MNTTEFDNQMPEFQYYSDFMLFEIAWEVCNQVGGIYTVIRSKVPSVIDKVGKENYFLIGPYFPDQAGAVFDPATDFSDPVGQAVLKMQERGFDIHYGNWIVSGRPNVILFNPVSVFDKLAEIKFEIWNNHHISLPGDDSLLNQVIAFSYQVREFFKALCQFGFSARNIIAHFHEWMAGFPIADIRRERLNIKTVFTTHATMLGRYLAMNDMNFYDHLSFYKWEAEAQNFNVKPIAYIERAAAHGAHVFTTVSRITGEECEKLLGRKPDLILPNGLNIERFEALHKVQNLHLKYKELIHDFVMGHFFQSYSFDLDKTLYFFTSGRYEYHNKGFDLTLEALARLNWRMQQANIDQTVVMFFVTKRDFYTFNPHVLHSKAQIEDIHRVCEEILEQAGNKLYFNVTSGGESQFKFPDISSLIEDHLKLKLRRIVQSWKTNLLPKIITHTLKDDSKDEILQFLRTANLVNNRHDKVKIVYHPDFIVASNPLFKMDYQQFVRGCHLGIFPSYYEPWGYTPLECLASGLPSITSDLTGFGDYVQDNIGHPDEKGLYIIGRKNKGFHETADEMADVMFRFVNMSRRERIALRYKCEDASVHFDWQNLGKHYDEAYNMALER